MDTKEQVEKWEVGPLTLSQGIEQRAVLIKGVDPFAGGYICNAASARAERIVRDHNERAELIAALKEFLSSGIEFDDSRMGYVVMQVDRRTIAEARALLDKVNKQ